MKDKGKFLNKKRWISYCSAHRVYNENCNICNSGTWESVWKLKITDFGYKIKLQIWTWLINK